jgi:hypothetical protein
MSASTMEASHVSESDGTCIDSVWERRGSDKHTTQLLVVHRRAAWAFVSAVAGS